MDYGKLIKECDRRKAAAENAIECASAEKTAESLMDSGQDVAISLRYGGYDLRFRVPDAVKRVVLSLLGLMARECRGRWELEAR